MLKHLLIIILLIISPTVFGHSSIEPLVAKNINVVACAHMETDCTLCFCLDWADPENTENTTPCVCMLPHHWPAFIHHFSFFALPTKAWGANNNIKPISQNNIVIPIWSPPKIS